MRTTGSNMDSGTSSRLKEKSRINNQPVKNTNPNHHQTQQHNNVTLLDLAALNNLNLEKQHDEFYLHLNKKSK